MAPSAPRRPLLAALAALAALALVAPDAAAKGPRKQRVVWTDVVLPEGAERARREALLRGILEKEGRRADWGKGRAEPVEAEVHVKDLRVTVEGDVLRVTCAASGKIRKLGVAKSSFSYGGKVTERAALERRVLELVARGLIARLAEMARIDHERRTWHVVR